EIVVGRQDARLGRAQLELRRGEVARPGGEHRSCGAVTMSVKPVALDAELLVDGFAGRRPSGGGRLCDGGSSEQNKRENESTNHGTARNVTSTGGSSACPVDRYFAADSS